ncbi:MAG TPA: protein kinase [Blastocatellia bacterium]|nr:protein kinase [Blastocatellia bacterium]
MMTNSIAHYKILEKLGAGGMGEVYLAEDTRLGRKVALKLLPVSYQYDLERRERFVREARAASALHSPNVAAIYDFGESDDAMFIAMEYVEGELLSKRLESGPLDINQAIDIAMQVCEALDEAHSLSIVHRDIKSSNVIVTTGGLVKVLDFGLVKIVPTQNPPFDDATVGLGLETAPGVILGTLAFMSPEQARGLEVDGRSDLFSLGVLLYEMLTGKRPFAGATTGDLLAEILRKEPEPLARSSPAIPAEMQWIVLKALRKDRTLRYQTARDFIADLRVVAQSLKTRPLPLVGGFDYTASLYGHPLVCEPITRDFGARRRARKQIDSIAVLPLINSTDDPDLDYLSDGITESLINALSRVPKLRVMARSTVFRYKGREVDPQRVGHDLNVRAVMIGRMQRIRDYFTIGAELVDVLDGSLLWGEQYARKPADILPLQNEISSDIAEQLRLKVTSNDRRRLARAQTRNPEAYELYLKGRYHFGKWTEAGLREAKACYERALGSDPSFALAYSGLGEVFCVQSYFSSDPAQVRTATSRSRACAQRALEIDDALAEAHLLLANLAHHYDWQWDAAEQEFKVALDLNPNLADGHLSYGLFLMDGCRFQEAAAEMEMAWKLDPLSLPAKTSKGLLLFYAGRYDEAVSQLRKSLALDPGFPLSELDPTYQLSHQMLGAALERTGKQEEAVTEYLRMLPEWKGREEMSAALRAAYTQAGMNGFWRSFADFADDLSERKVTTPVFVATIYAALGEPDAAFAWIEKAFNERTPALTHLKADPRFETLHADARFAVWLQRLGLMNNSGSTDRRPVAGESVPL